MRLSSRFSSADEAEPGRAGRQYRSDPEEDTSVPGEMSAVDPVVRINAQAKSVLVLLCVHSLLVCRLLRGSVS